MYNVMLVDDDYPVLEFLSASIPWEKLGFRLQGAFGNAADALEQAKKELPDILITDIGMPHMSGLELIELLREQQPKLRTIIVSCLDDFECAQQAVRLGVDEYILKESFQPNDIASLLEKLRDQIHEEEQTMLQMNVWKNMAAESKVIMKKTFIHHTLEHPGLAEQEWELTAKDLGINFQASPYIPVLCYLDHYLDVKKRFVNDHDLVFAIQNILDELTASIPGAVCSFYSPKMYVLWFPMSLKTESSERLDLTEQISVIQEALSRYLKIRTSYILGKACFRMRDVKVVLPSLIYSDDSRFYLEPYSIHRQLVQTFSKDDLFTHYSQALQQFLQSFLEQDSLKAESLVADWISMIKEKRYRPKLVKEWAWGLMHEIQNKLRSMEHFQTQFSAEVLLKTMEQIDTLAQLEQWMLQFMREMIPFVSSIYLQSKHPEIMQARRYVQQHLDQKISLEEMAKFLHMNPSYFSRLFKKETGENFIEYITRVKMERAKELLDWTWKSVEEISAEVGYENKSYFTKVFKTTIGLTPGEYRDKRERNRQIQ